MKIAYFSDSYKPYMSGVVRSVELFSERLRERGDEVHIFAPDYPEAKEEKDVYRFKSIPAFTHPSFRLALPLSARLINRLNKWKPDLIHTHSPFLLGLLARIMAGRLDIPLVFTYHTLYEEYAHYVPLGEEMVRKAALKYSKNYCQNSDLIIAPSQYVYNRLKNMDVSTQISIIPTGVDLRAYQDVDYSWVREELSLSEEDNILLFVGRLGEEKRIPLLLHSFVQINKEQPNTKLVLVGDGPQKKELQEICRSLDLEDSVYFAGQRSPQEVVAFYRASDLFVFGSPTETQGLVLVEAMAGGLPVVSVAAAGACFIVEDRREGHLVEKDNKEQFIESVLTILGDKDLYNEMKERALEKASQYSMDNMAAEIRASYQKLINEYEGSRQLA